MSDKVTAGHMDERFDEVKAELQQIHRKIDTNARAAEARFHVLESRLPGHSDDQIIEMIDARLQAVLPDMLREAVTDGLTAPLKTLSDHTDRLDKLQPLSDSLETIIHLRRFILWTAPVLTAFLTAAAVITILGAFA